VKLSAGGAGNAYAYRRGPRRALVIAASSHPKDLLTPLTNNVVLGSGETIEILYAEQEVQSLEGAVIWS
jgi:hypothetical protein